MMAIFVSASIIKGTRKIEIPHGESRGMLYPRSGDPVEIELNGRKLSFLLPDKIPCGFHLMFGLDTALMALDANGNLDLIIGAYNASRVQDLCASYPIRGWRKQQIGKACAPTIAPPQGENACAP